MSSHHQAFNTSYFNSTSNKKLKLLGHRGARGEALENSRSGFIYTQHLSELSLNKCLHKLESSHDKNTIGAVNSSQLVGIEFDVQLTRDGKLAVFHDETLHRLYNMQQRVDQSDFDTLKSLTQSVTDNNDLALMELSEMPSYLEGYQHIELEVKTHQRTNYALLVQALHKALNCDEFEGFPITVTSFDLRLHYYLKHHSFLSQIKRGLLIEDPQHKPAQLPRNFHLNKAPNLAKELGCVAMGWYYRLYDASIVAQCKRLGLTTSAWTVNSFQEALNLHKMGVDYIITDFPKQLLRDI